MAFLDSLLSIVLDWFFYETTNIYWK
jgi:hypothetical protein